MKTTVSTTVLRNDLKQADACVRSNLAACVDHARLGVGLRKRKGLASSHAMFFFFSRPAFLFGVFHLGVLEEAR